MKLLTIAVGAISAIALTAGAAAAQMQPIPNPPEKAMHGKMHHKKHHHHAAKKADADAKADKAAATGDKAAMAADKKADKAEKKPDKK
jgi:hypothetical protein